MINTHNTEITIASSKLILSHKTIQTWWQKPDEVVAAFRQVQTFRCALHLNATAAQLLKLNLIQSSPCPALVLLVETATDKNIWQTIRRTDRINVAHTALPMCNHKKTLDITISYLYNAKSFVTVKCMQKLSSYWVTELEQHDGQRSKVILACWL